MKLIRQIVNCISYIFSKGRIIAAPFFRVGFADFWLADQFNSLAAVFTDLHYTFCFYLTHNWLNGGTAIVGILGNIV